MPLLDSSGSAGDDAPMATQPDDAHYHLVMGMLVGQYALVQPTFALDGAASLAPRVGVGAVEVAV
jgi:hypothetical protein